MKGCRRGHDLHRFLSQSCDAEPWQVVERAEQPEMDKKVIILAEYSRLRAFGCLMFPFVIVGARWVFLAILGQNPVFFGFMYDAEPRTIVKLIGFIVGMGIYYFVLIKGIVRSLFGPKIAAYIDHNRLIVPNDGEFDISKLQRVSYGTDLKGHYAKLYYSPNMSFRISTIFLQGGVSAFVKRAKDFLPLTPIQRD